jgi:hypothetical protein
MKEQRAAGGSDSEREPNLSDGRQVLRHRNEFDRGEQLVLDVLAQDLSREFPNPDRVGCPDLAVLRGIAFGKLRLAEVHQWLDHLSSCSPCYQEFTALRKQALGQRRRLQAWLAVAALVIVGLPVWLWMRTHPGVRPPETAVVDLRGFSLERGENASQTDRPPLELHRSTKHLILDLPIGSAEGAYEIALLTESGAQLVSATGTSQLENRVVVLQAQVDIGEVRPGVYYLALRRPGLEWNRYAVRVV